MNLKRIGIIGGAGPYASTLFLKRLVDLCYERGLGDAPDIRLINFPFTRGLQHDAFKEHQKVIQDEMQRCIDSLMMQGVELFVVVCNTLHHFVKKARCYGMELVNIPETVMEEVEKKKLSKALLLATETTLKVDLYRSSGVELLKPTFEEIALLSAIINRILDGEMKREDSHQLRRLIKAHQERESFEGVILGCTELPVLFNAFPFTIEGVTLFDSINISVNRVIIEVSS